MAARHRQNAESAVLACKLELQAARDNSRPRRAINLLIAALAAATVALALARRPFKYVTNWCFSPKGTENLAHLVRGWRESTPKKGILADDNKAMYQNVSRKASFDFLRKRFPALLAVTASSTTSAPRSGLGAGCCQSSSLWPRVVWLPHVWATRLAPPSFARSSVAARATAARRDPHVHRTISRVPQRRPTPASRHRHHSADDTYATHAHTRERHC